MIRKPLILIPVSNPPKTYLSALNSVELDYVADFSHKNLDYFHGLLLTGGGDILPSFYGKNIDCHNVNPIRDVNEMKLFEYFFTKNAPVLGVCRGMQLINVCLGGTLKTVDGHQSKDGKDVRHSIKPSNGLFKSLNMVNSNHKQCVDKPCDLAENSIFSTDGILEGFTVKNTVAVQFHPERMDLTAINLIYGEFAKRVNSYFESLSHNSL